MTADWTPHCLVCGRPASDPCQRCAELDPTDERDEFGTPPLPFEEDS